jgi:hypothetical protein
MRLRPCGFDTGRVGATRETSESTRRRKFVSALPQKNPKPAILCMNKRIREETIAVSTFIFYLFIFLSFFGWGETGFTLYVGHYWLIVPAPNDRCWFWSIRWNENCRGKPKHSEKTCPSATSYTTNPTWPDLGSNPARRGGKPVINRPNNCTIQLSVTAVSHTHTPDEVVNAANAL